MSLQSNDDTDTDDASLDQQDLIPDPFEVAVDDLVGLDDITTILADSYLPGLTDTPRETSNPLVLLYGDSGAGVGRVARAIAGSLGAHGFDCLQLPPSEVGGESAHVQARYPGAEVATVLDSLTDNAPATLLVDPFERVRLQKGGPLTQKLSTIRSSGHQVAVIGVLRETNPTHPQRNNPEYRALADFICEVPWPSTTRRAALLEELITDELSDTTFTLAADIEFEELADSAENLPLDVYRTVARRSIVHAQTQTDGRTITEPILATTLERVVTERTPYEDWDADGPGGAASDDALYRTDPPDVHFSDVGGLEDTIARLQDLLTLPEEFADVYESANITPGHGLLLYGPPGTGKTLVASALANETDRTFYAVKGPEVKSKWFGESEQRIRRLFEHAEETAPSLVFFDEFDSLAANRESLRTGLTTSIVNTLLTELDGLEERGDLLVVAATNRPDALDEAVLRPGRLDEQIEVPPPTASGRAEIFAIHADGLPTTSQVTPEWFASRTTDLTGAEIEEICERALQVALRAVRNDQREALEVTRSDVERARDQVASGVDGSQEVRGYE